MGVEGVRAELAMMETPDGHERLELIKSTTHRARGRPARAGEHPGIRHLTFAVVDIDAAVAGLRAHGGEPAGEVENYEDIYRLCYLRGPEGIIIELAERIDERRSSRTVSQARLAPGEWPSG